MALSKGGQEARGVKRGFLVKILTPLLFLSFLTGCGRNKLIDYVSVVVPDNLEAVRVGLVFKPTIKTELLAQVAIKNYGYLFVNPTTSLTPFEIGFYLQTDIVNENEYLSLEPTRYLPNGTTLGLDYPIVQVKSKEPVSSKFDVFAYVDVLHGRWLGAGVVLNFIDQKNFPDQFSIVQGFSRNETGSPQVIAMLYGPTLNSDQSLKTPGGVVVLADVKGLLRKPDETPVETLPVTNDFSVIGENARFYSKPKALMKLQDRFINQIGK